MDWIIEHLRVIILLIVVVVWVMRSFGRRVEDAADHAPRQPPARDEAEQAERTRQIQEEIRRRILARQRGESVPPPVPAQDAGFEPAPVTFERETEAEDPDYSGEGPRTPMPTAAARERERVEAARAAVLERQRVLAEQMQALRTRQIGAPARGTGASTRAMMLPASASAAIDAHNLAARRELRRDLRHPSSLRRAILLKEILGLPVALQQGRDLPRR